MKTKLNYSMLTVLGLLALKAQAVGLGELVVHSKLGEPLSAEIEIIQGNGEFVAADDMLVTIASEKEHASRALDGYLARKNLKLKLEETLSDDVSLKLNSIVPINEPFLNFLVELKWNTGRLIKEFTILLDPPGFEPEQAAPVITQTSTKTVVRNIPTSSKQIYNFPATRKPITDTPFINGQYGPVQKGETLSEIAMRVRPAGQNIRLIDMIDAIYTNNIDAFINGDKNLLQKGVTLAIPNVVGTSDYSNKPSQLVSSTSSNKVDNTVQLITRLDDTLSANALNNSHTFSGLKLSTELDQSFLAAVKENNEASISSIAEQEAVETTVIEELEISEQNVIAETEVFDNEFEEETIATDSNNDEAIVEEKITEPVNDSIVNETIETEATVEPEFKTTVSPTNEAGTIDTESSSEVTSSPNPVYLAISIIGAILFISMSLLWFYLRRNKYEDSSITRQIDVNRAEVIPPRVFSYEESDKTENIIFDSTIDEQEIEPNLAIDSDSELLEDQLDYEMDMDQTISEKNENIATVVMSPEEFNEVGIDINQKEEDGLYKDKETEGLSSEQEQTLIKDFLNTVEINEVIDLQQPIEEHSDFSVIENNSDNDSDDSETFIDISIPLNHQDNEVNTIINEILEGELPEEDLQTVNDTDDNDELELLESPLESDELETIDFDNAEDKSLINELIDLDSETEASDELEPIELTGNDIEFDADDELYEPEVFDQPNIEDLVVNFQTSHPEKEFEKQVSVFMAYGDYTGAEEVIEKALKQQPENNTYRLAQLSLFKATGKYGAALVLSEELSLIKNELTEIEQKKLELLSDDLNQADDDSMNFAS